MIVVDEIGNYRCFYTNTQIYKVIIPLKINLSTIGKYFLYLVRFLLTPTGRLRQRRRCSNCKLIVGVAAVRETVAIVGVVVEVQVTEKVALNIAANWDLSISYSDRD